ncbi:MAG TPA: GntR family transcriptional regulator [Candidatus Limnocylindrales bacterium]|nr:GntR family transcriptional regulator [Candidatus Limnocylindrales bacterium]
MPKEPIEPIRRSTLSSIVTERIRELIVQGTYPPGTQLSEVELAARFGVSRGPVREALQRLLQEGLLRREPRRGISVPILSAADVADIYLAREAIEGAALRAIVEAGRGRTVATELRRLVRQMQEAAAAERWSRVAELDMRFHTEVVAAAGSPRLTRMYASLIDETRALLAMTVSYPGREDLVEEHAELAEILGSGDLEALREALARHFSESRETLGKQLALSAPAAAAR